MNIKYKYNSNDFWWNKINLVNYNWEMVVMLCMTGESVTGSILTLVWPNFSLERTSLSNVSKVSSEGPSPSSLVVEKPSQQLTKVSGVTPYLSSSSKPNWTATKGRLKLRVKQEQDHQSLKRI